MKCMNWFVYILKGNNREYYKGLTSNLEKRLNQHLLGQNTTTKQMGGFVLVHVEVCHSREEARNLEKYFKSGFGREVISELF